MEDLLASIRKAIQEDIGDVPAGAYGRAASSQPARGPRDLHERVSDEIGSAAAEIQQLRERIQRTRSPGQTHARQQSVRTPATDYTDVPLAEAPRRSWRDIEAAPPLRPTLVEPAPVRRQVVAEPARIQPSMDQDYRLRQQPADPFASRMKPVAEPRRENAQALPVAPGPGDLAMMSGNSVEAVQAAFNRLADNIVRQSTSDRSIEDITRELLRGMLKQWLDENLPQLVERLVREEIERVARHGR